MRIEIPNIIGIWEKEGFGNRYTFDRDESEHISRRIQIKITFAIVCLQSFLPNPRRADSGKVILVGSTAALSNANNARLTFVASESAIRRIGEALRRLLDAGNNRRSKRRPPKTIRKESEAWTTSFLNLDASRLYN